MDGAREFCKLFSKAEQVGRLYILPHFHARGKTFRVFVLPEGEEAIENHGINPPLNDDTVMVYGIISGNPGWTESYGWLYEGKWQEDFNSICRDRQEQQVVNNKKDRVESMKKEVAAKDKIASLLDGY